MSTRLNHPGSGRHRLRLIRRLAMQILYQIDATGETDPQTLLANVDEDHDPVEVREAAVGLAVEAWQSRETADALVRELAPEWPTHRQPPVDRAILRLAHHEMATGRTPVKIAINEAVELAKQYGSEHSPPFVNGVLDKLSKRITPKSTPQDESPQAWLRDAMTSDGDNPVMLT